MQKNQQIFLSFYEDSYSRSAVLLKSESDLFERIYYKLSSNSIAILLEFKKILKKHKGQINSVIVMSPSHKAVPIIRFFCHYPLILDAGWPLIDGHTSRRGPNFNWSLRSLFSYSKLRIIDFLSFNLADIVLLETSVQSKRVHETFRIKRKKLKVSFTGFNEAGQVQNSVERISGEEKIIQPPTRVLFRGKINYESGFSNIVEAMKLLDDTFEITYVVDQIPKFHVLQQNERFITNFKDADLTSIYKQADICIGQISSHERLEVTIPHKAFEAAYFSKAYISAENVAIRELASEEEVFLLKKPTPEALSEAIMEIASDQTLNRLLGKNFNKKYKQLASQKVLGTQFDKWVLELSQKYPRRV